MHFVLKKFFVITLSIGYALINATTNSASSSNIPTTAIPTAAPISTATENVPYSTVAAWRQDTLADSISQVFAGIEQSSTRIGAAITRLEDHNLEQAPFMRDGDIENARRQFSSWRRRRSRYYGQALSSRFEAVRIFESTNSIIGEIEALARHEDAGARLSAKEEECEELNHSTISILRTAVSIYLSMSNLAGEVMSGHEMPRLHLSFITGRPR